MKINKLFLCAAIVATATTISSCQSDDNQTTDPPVVELSASTLKQYIAAANRSLDGAKLTIIMEQSDTIRLQGRVRQFTAKITTILDSASQSKLEYEKRTIEGLQPDTLDLLEFYTGNTMYQYELKYSQGGTVFTPSYCRTTVGDIYLPNTYSVSSYKRDTAAGTFSVIEDSVILITINYNGDDDIDTWKITLTDNNGTKEYKTVEWHSASDNKTVKRSFVYRTATPTLGTAVGLIGGGATETTFQDAQLCN